MVHYCVASNCKNKPKTNNSVSFHRFPLSRPEILQKWVSFIRRENFKPSKSSRICSEHFTEDCYQLRPGAVTKRLKEDAVPTVFNYNPQMKRPVKKKRISPPQISDAPKVTPVKLSKTYGGNRCSIGTCNNSAAKCKSSGLSVRFFGFPKDKATRKAWIAKCHREDETAIKPETARICSEHFTEKDYADVLKAKLMGITPRKLKKKAVPSLLLHTPKPQCNHTKKRPDAKKQKEVINELPEEHKPVEESKVHIINLSKPMPGETVCSVANCKSNSKRAKEDVKFFGFPNKQWLKKEWVKACGQKDNFDPKFKKVCSLHFQKKDYEAELQGQVMNYKLKKEAVPSVNLPSTSEAERTTSPVQSSLLEEKINSSDLSKELVEECLKQYHEILQVQNFPNEEKETVFRLNARSSAKKRIKYPVKLNKTLTANDADQPTAKKTVFVNAEMQSDASDDGNLSDGDELLSSSSEKTAGYSEKNLSVVGRRKVSECSDENCQNKLKALEHKLAAVQQEYMSSFEDIAKDRFKGFLSANQVSVALNKKTKTVWSQEDMSKAFSILCLSKPCYQHLRNALHYPLPGLLTLRKWASAKGKPWPVEDNALNQSNESENLPSEADNVNESLNLQNQQPDDYDSFCHNTNSDQIPDRNDKSDESYNIAEQQINNFHSAPYIHTGTRILTNGEGKSNGNLNPEYNQIETSENIINDSEDIQSKRENSKIVTLKCKRAPSISAKKFKFQSYLTNYLNKKNKVALSKSSSEKETSYTCLICQQKFNKHITLQRHYKIHIPKESLKCQ